MPTVEQVFSLPHAIISLYEADADGEAISATPLYLGALAENISIGSKLEVVKTWPSGRRYPIDHHVGESHDITIGRVWLTKQDFEPVNPNDDDFEFMPVRNQSLILAIAWQDKDQDDRWVARIFWEVKSNGDDLSNRDIAEFIQSNTFSAQYMTRSQGKGLVCPVA